MITVRIEEVARRTGLWCDTCFLPSVYEIDVAFEGRENVAGTITRCSDCEEQS
jgi:hypothetical protein